jgi:hypothetical protein
LRKVLLSLGEECLGAPAPDWAATALAQIDRLEELESLAKKVLRVQSWADLLPQPRKSSRRKKGALDRKLQQTGARSSRQL